MDKVGLLFYCSVDEAISSNEYRQPISGKKISSVMRFQDNYDKVPLRDIQKSNPLGLKKKTCLLSPVIPISDNSGNKFKNSVFKESEDAQESIIRHRNSQDESDIFHECKFDDFNKTKSSKF
jgi:hypothetical protein